MSVVRTRYAKTGVRGKKRPPVEPEVSQHIENVLDERQYLEHAYNFREAHLKTGDLFGPSEYLLRYCVKTKPQESVRLAQHDCEYLIWRYIQRLLDLDQYQAAAIVCWGPELFTPEPHCTRLVWSGLRDKAKNLIMGGGSLSKSYSGAVYFGLDFLRDPEWTCIKVMSVTRQHAVTNVFAHLKNLLSNVIVPVPSLSVKSESVRVNNDDKQGIHLTSIPMGDDGKGRLRGFHPVPRPVPHPRFGKLSRIALILDEAEEIPEGVWEDVNNVLLTEEADNSHVKVFAATNPKDRNSKFGFLAEPRRGWASVDIDTDETWESARGYNVIRLDGAKCENVIEKKVVFPGLQTWEGFERLLKLGTDNPEYHTMARGWFPESSSSVVIVNESMFERAKGLYTFSGPTTMAAGIDLAFEGNDLAFFTAARFGTAIGWTDMQGSFQRFKTERRVIQVEQQISLEKRDTIEQTKAIIRLSNDMGVKPRWLSVDRTGNGTGVHDALKSMFGPDVFGIMFSWAASDTRILDDDSETCSERYNDVVTEMAFSLRKFIETDLLKLNPGINWNALGRETVTRRYMQVGRGVLRIEPKKDFKKRNGDASPDRFDSLLVAIHGIRMSGGISGRMVEESIVPKRRPDRIEHGLVDSLEFIDMSSDL
jgi:hypothetical protein